MNVKDRRRVSLLGLGLLVVLAGCGGGGDGEKDGACVFTYRLDANVALCEDGYASSECSDAQDENYTSAFNEGRTCAALGFTLTCAGDPAGFYRRTCP